jgi:23S rRNA pseudouridine1911/1915/1917 synthase
VRFDQADFRILGETDSFLGVEKPAGLLVHPTRPDGPRTLWDGLRELLSYEVATGGQVSLINRLDRETSGVVLVAKSASAARLAAMAMQAGEVAKSYLAILTGHPHEDTFTIDHPILRRGEVLPSPIHLQRMVHPSGARATTTFRIIRRFENNHGPFALAEAVPATGRTHQIRVHASFAGHHVVGDKIYGPSEQCYLEFIRAGWTQSLAERLLLPRHALHSATISLRAEGRDILWRSPLPPDLAEFAGEPPTRGDRAPRP